MTADHLLLTALDTLTRQHADGISEFELINHLDQDASTPFFKPDMSDPWALFQVHFWLFHHLYLLKLSLRDEGETLDIVATRIRRFRLDSESAANSGPHNCDEDAVSGAEGSDQTAIGMADPMQAYYLDLDNLEQETPAGVASKLDAFWLRLAEPGQQHVDWQTLGLEPPVSAKELQQQYRRLCQRHHPDRGGSAKQFRAVQAAYARLKPLSPHQT